MTSKESLVESVRRLTNGATILAAGALVISLATASPASAQEPDKIIIGFPTDVIAISSLRAADELGLYAKHGIRPSFTYFDSGNTATMSLVAGSVQFSVGGPSDLIAAQSRGQKLASIGVIYGGVANSLVLSKATVAKLGVSPHAPAKERLKALDGLILSGTSPTAGAFVALRGQAAFAGANPKYSYMSYDAMMAALETGVINGYVAPFPVSALPVLKGTAVTWLSGPGGDFLPEFSPGVSSVVMTKRDYAESHRDLMKRMAAVREDFVKVMESDPARVRAIVGKLYPQLDSKVIDFFFANEASAAWKSKPLDAKGWAHEIEFMKNAGSISAELLKPLDPASMAFP